MSKRVKECKGKTKCNWWTLLDEIKDEMENGLIDMTPFTSGGYKKYGELAEFNRREILSLFSHSANIVCERHLK